MLFVSITCACVFHDLPCKVLNSFAFAEETLKVTVQLGPSRRGPFKFTHCPVHVLITASHTKREIILFVTFQISLW